MAEGEPTGRRPRRAASKNVNFLEPYMCLRYGPDAEVDAQSVPRCDNYTTMPPQEDWCSQNCENCSLTPSSSSKDPCALGCTQWCNCTYSHIYELNRDIWEELMTLGDGQTASTTADNYESLLEIPDTSSSKFTKLNVTPKPGAVNRLSCADACDEDISCTAFTWYPANLKCEFYKVEGCPDCKKGSNWDCQFPTEKRGEQWFYKKCTDKTPAPSPTPT